MTNIKASDNRRKMAKGAKKYWTKKRMAKATPLELRNAPKDIVSKTKQDGKSRTVQGKLPKSAKRQAASTTEVPNYSAFPVSCVGKIFMREGSSDYVGSAWVIGDRTIFTAAHCVFDDNGTFFDDVVFVPQYKNGSAPHGNFPVVQMAIDDRYAAGTSTDLNYDLGIGILDKKISDITGVVSFQEFPTSQVSLGASVKGVGYPAGPPFDGSKMYQSSGQVVAAQSSSEGYFGAENEMTGGCSGGPWFDPSGVVVGLNSFVFVNQTPPVMYSPYFGTGFTDLIEWANDKDGGVGVDDDNGDGGQVDKPGTNDEIEDIKSELKAQIKEMKNTVDKL